MTAHTTGRGLRRPGLPALGSTEHQRTLAEIVMAELTIPHLVAHGCLRCWTDQA